MVPVAPAGIGSFVTTLKHWGSGRQPGRPAIAVARLGGGDDSPPAPGPASDSPTLTAARSVPPHEGEGGK
jgi:hypothetical protein